MNILHIETSTNVCSVALTKNGESIFSIYNAEGQNHAAMLSPFIQKAIDRANELQLTIEAIAVSEGPGSYTGLRIGVSTAKGLCYGYDVPLIAIDTLEILCMQVIKNQTIEKNALFCPMIDARRMEVYTAFYSTKIEKLSPTSAEIISENSFSEMLEKHIIYFFGNGSDKCKSIISHPNARFINEIVPLAENMISPAECKYKNKEFADVAYFEPLYLKEFQTTTSKK